MAHPRKTPLYPASLDLRGVAALVVGGGAVAARKTASLLRAAARVTVVAPAFAAQFGKLAKRTRLRRAKRRFRTSDLKGQQLVFAATDDPALNVRIAEAARRRGLWVNVAAPGDTGNLQVPATLRRGPLCISVSTRGASAALAAQLRQRLARTVGPEWGQLALLLERRRARILREVTAAAVRRGLLRQLAQPAWAARIRRRGAVRVAREMDRVIGEAAQ